MNNKIKVSWILKYKLFVIITLGIILRLISLDQSLWLDEAINTLAVKDYSFLDLLTKYAQADFHPPGWLIILWVWGKLFGYSEIAVRIPSVIFGVLTVYFTYLIGKKLVSINLGLLAALLISINPLHIYYSQEARMYAFATLAVAINIFILIKLVKGEKINLFLLILSNVLVLLSDYLAYFIYPAQFIFLLITQNKEVIKKWFIALMTAVVLGFWWFPTFLGQLNVGGVASANLPTWKFVVGGFDFKTLPLTFVKFIIGRISLIDKVMYTSLLLPVCTLFGFLIIKGIRNLDGLSKKLLIAWVSIPLAVATIISIFIPVYSYFRVLFVLPAFILLISSGILFLKKKLKYTMLGIVVLVEIFCTLVYLSNPSFHREDWRGLVNYLNAQKSQIILFESSGTLPPFEYYANNTLNTKGALKDFPANDENGILDLKELLKDSREVYLVDYLVQITDPKRLVAKRLNDLGYKEKDIKIFTGVGFVYLYTKNE